MVNAMDINRRQVRDLVKLSEVLVINHNQDNVVDPNTKLGMNRLEF